jgi:hypothetical protein
MGDQEILGLSESYNQVIANEIESEEKSGSPRPTFMPKSRERDIGKHDDWKDKPAEDWNDKTSEQKKADKLRRRASAVVQTQRRQDRETNVREEVLSYLLDEGFASDEKSAEAIMDAMSEAWIESIVEGAAGAFVPSEVDDSNNRRDMLKNRYGQDVSPRIPGPSGGGQFEKPSSNPAGALRLAKTSSKGDTKTA